MGRIKSLPKRVFRGTGHEITKEKILKPILSKSGYYSVMFCKSGFKNKGLRINRLVCAAFHENPENKPQVNHKNGIKTDNRAVNLEWCTAKENMIHARDNGLLKINKPWLGKFGAKHHGCKPIYQLNMNGDVIREWDCMRDATRFFGICEGHISMVCNGKRNSAGGFKWRLKNE